ncbi:MAG TPA: OmpA family protein [Terriglobales bacterium]|nr:OmpA family protein [Terriglobales bacterium]
MSASLRCARVFAFILLALLVPAGLTAQNESVPKADIFVGYQWAHPGANVPAPFSSPINPSVLQLPDLPKGFGASFTYNFDPHWGLEADLGHNWDRGTYETTVSAGPRLMFRIEDGDYFVHAMVSYNRLGVSGLDSNNGIGGIFGGGMDYKITRRVSWRIFEADYVVAHHNYAQFFPSSLRQVNLQGEQLRTGFLFNFGYAEAAPVSASVSVKPTEVMAGEPLAATATASNFNPKHTLTYQWTSTCGKISGTGETASIDTNGVPGGSCTVNVQVVDPKGKKNNSASASTSFTVKEPPKNPPTVSCSANPTSVQAGGTASISCTCSSPDNVPVSMGNFTASSGTISGSGNTATLNTAGVSPGTVTVNASCSDQRGLNTPATTEVTVTAPPPPPVNPEIKRLEQRLALHSIYFPTAQPTAAKPNAGLVKSQQETLIALAADFKKYLESKPDAHLILEGHADPRGSAEYNQALSERRVNRTKGFLIGQGVPEANIETKAFGAQQQLSSDQVRQSVEQASDITPGEKQRILKNMRTIILASNRRVDVTLSAPGVEQTSVRQFPFNAADALTLIGGREKPAAPAKPARKRKKK